MPFDFIEDTAATRGATVDREAFERAMEGQRDKARAGSAFGGGKKDKSSCSPAATLPEQVGDQFEGYTATTVTGVPVLALFDGSRQPVDALATGTTGLLRSPARRSISKRVVRSPTPAAS